MLSIREANNSLDNEFGSRHSEGEQHRLRWKRLLSVPEPAAELLLLEGRLWCFENDKAGKKPSSTKILVNPCTPI
jgi:hypothetical protein